MSSSDQGFDLPRLGRILALIGFVTAVFLVLAALRLPGNVQRAGFFAIGGIAVVTAITGVLIAGAGSIGREVGSVEEREARRAAARGESPPVADQDGTVAGDDGRASDAGGADDADGGTDEGSDPPPGEPRGSTDGGHDRQ